MTELILLLPLCLSQEFCQGIRGLAVWELNNLIISNEEYYFAVIS